MFKADVKGGGQRTVLAVTQQGSCLTPMCVGVGFGVNGRENRKTATLCEMQMNWKALKPPRQISSLYG